MPTLVSYCTMHTVMWNMLQSPQILQTPDSSYISVFLSYTSQYLLTSHRLYKHRKTLRRMPTPVSLLSHTQFSALPFSAHRFYKLRVVPISVSSCHTHCNASHSPPTIQTPGDPYAARLRQCPHCHTHSSVQYLSVLTDSTNSG